MIAHVGWLGVFIGGKANDGRAAREVAVA